MRPLTEEETKTFFEKLSKYIGKNIIYLIEGNCFRLHKDRVYFVNENIMRKATNISRDNLVSLGVCFGKFTKGGKFRLSVSCIDLLSVYAVNKVWVKPQGEMSFLYGNHVIKAHVAKIQDAPEHSGIVVYNSNNVPLGFGVTAKSTEMLKSVDPNGIVVFWQGDCGEYLRSENDLS